MKKRKFKLPETVSIPLQFTNQLLIRIPPDITMRELGRLGWMLGIEFTPKIIKKISGMDRTVQKTRKRKNK